MKVTARTSKAKIVGVLNIVAGTIWIISMIVAVPLLWVLIDDFITGTPGTGLLIYICLIALFIAAIGVVSILGGVAALHHHRWGLALAGSICSFFCIWPLSIATIVLLILAKKEFS